MIAYVSGEAARGALLRAGRFVGYVLDRSDAIPISKPKLRNFFLNCWDVELIECDSDADLRDAIEKRWKDDRTLKLVLLSLDKETRPDIRGDAARCADNLLGDEHCLNYVRNHLYATPLPPQCDTAEVSGFLSEAMAPRLEEMFDSLVFRQGDVQNCVAAWDQLPDEIFEDSAEREEIRARIVRIGAFYRFATFDVGSNDALFQILADPIVSQRAAKARVIVAEWASKYKQMPSRKIFEFDRDGERWMPSGDGNAGGASGFEMFQRVKKQKVSIKEELIAKNYAKADELINLLVADQRTESSKEHIAKSLCDLAIFCKGLGDLERYFDLTLRATVEAPEDAWAFTQLGSAYTAKGEFPGAIGCFERAEVFGDGRAALVGRAEALKYMGQKDIALSVLDRCIRENPLDLIARNARAATLAHFGDFEKALRSYDELITSPLADGHSYGGRASVLHDVGRYDEALRDQEMAVHLAGDDPIPYCAKADMLRERGSFFLALQSLDVKLKHSHAQLMLESVKSRVYRDSGDFASAEQVLRDIQYSFPRDVMSKVALADLWRKGGRLDDALELFLKIEVQFPNSRIGRNSIAATYAALGRFDEALSYLPPRGASTKSDWIAQHIRAMIDMKLGKWDDAQSLLADGLESCPWKQQRVFFGSALASLKLRQGLASAARDVIASSVEYETPLAAGILSAIDSHVALANGLDFDLARSESLALNPAVHLFVKRLEGVAVASANDARIANELFELEWQALLAVAA